MSTPASVAMGTLRCGIVDHRRRHRSALETRERPEHQRQRIRQRLVQGLATHIPRRAELRRVERHPAHGDNQHQRDQPGDEQQSIELPDEARTHQVDHGDGPQQQHGEHRSLHRSGAEPEETGEITRCRRGNGHVADEAGRPIPEARLRPPEPAEGIERISGGSTRHWFARRQPGKQQRQRQGADGANDPAEHGEAAHRRERGRQQEHSRADHVAGDDDGGEDRPQLALTRH